MKPGNVEMADHSVGSWNKFIGWWKKGDWNNQYKNKEPIRWVDCKKKKE